MKTIYKSGKIDTHTLYVMQRQQDRSCAVTITSHNKDFNITVSWDTAEKLIERSIRQKQEFMGEDNWLEHLSE